MCASNCRHRSKSCNLEINFASEENKVKDSQFSKFSDDCLIFTYSDAFDTEDNNNSRKKLQVLNNVPNLDKSFLNCVEPDLTIESNHVEEGIGLSDLNKNTTVFKRNLAPESTNQLPSNDLIRSNFQSNVKRFPICRQFSDTNGNVFCNVLF